MTSSYSSFCHGTSSYVYHTCVLITRVSTVIFTISIIWIITTLIAIYRKENIVWHQECYIERVLIMMYRQTSKIRRTLDGNKIVDHSDVVGASPVDATPTTSSLNTYVLRSNLWSSQFVTVSQFVTESVAICDGCRNLWRKVSQFVTTTKYAI